MFRKKNKIDIGKSFIEVFDECFNKEFEDELSKKYFKIYVNLFQSFIDTENEITLKLFQFWNLKLKLKIDDLRDANDFRIGNLNKLMTDLLSKKLIHFDMNDIDEIEEKQEDENEDESDHNKKKKLYHNISIVDLEIDDTFDDINLNELSTTVVYDPEVDFLIGEDYEYQDEEAIEGENYIILNGKINEIKLNLLIKKITFDNFENEHYEQIKGFINQFCSFIDKEMLINKIMNAYYFYVKTNEKKKLYPLITFLNKIIISVYEFYKAMNIYKSNIITFYEELINDKSIKIKGINEIYELISTKYPTYNMILKVKNIIYNNTKEPIQFHKRIDLKNDNKSNEKHDYFCILDYSILDICEQLTYLSQSLFILIDRKEILGGKYMKKNKEINSPIIIKIINNSNYLSNFIIEDILSYNSTSLRAKIIERWILISDTLRKYKNFNDCISIQLALSGYIISSLKETWKEVNENSKNILKELANLFSPINNFQKLRKEIKLCKKQPYIPFLGLLLKDIAAYEEKFKYISKDHLINFVKIEHIENIFDNFFIYKDYQYIITEKEEFNFFDNLKTLPLNRLEVLSQQIESNSLSNVDYKTEKRKTLMDIQYFSKNNEEI